MATKISVYLVSIFSVLAGSSVFSEALVAQTSPSSTFDSALTWPQFRGPNHGHAPTDSKPPISWSEQKNVLWKAKTPGSGWSSPVISDGKLWLTTAYPKERSLRVLCFDIQSGKLLRNIELFRPKKLVQLHARNGHSTPTPTLDRKRLYVHYGTYGTAAIRLSDAKVVWRNTEHKIEHQWGPGSSPCLFEGKLVLNFDGMKNRFVVALDAETGKTLWKTKRSAETKDNGFFKKSFSTPVVVRDNGGAVVLTSGANQTCALNLNDGKELWSTSYFGYAGVTAPVVSESIAYATSGYGDGLIQAINLAGSKSKEAGKVLWSTKKNAPIIPTPVVVDGSLYMVSDRGILSCLDKVTGKVHWRKRLEGNFASSLLYVSGNLLLSNDRGKTFVIRPSVESCDIITANQLDSNIQATPAVFGNSIFIRTKNSLYRIGAQEKSQSTWIPLFDGKTTNGWRDFHGKSVSEKSWGVEEECLVSRGEPGDIITNKKFENFELEFQWKVSDKANSGVFFRVSEDQKQIHHSGLEYQVLDNVGQKGRPRNEQAAAAYGILGYAKDFTKPVGQWNLGKIKVSNGLVEYFLNGKSTVKYRIESQEFSKLVASGPLRNHASLAKTKKGYISLQNYHGHRVWFRGIRIRKITKNNTGK